jgi:hypothetical protein
VTVATPCNPPVIHGQPQSQTIHSGQSATLKVLASVSAGTVPPGARSATSPLSYQWYAGAPGDPAHSILIPGATGSSYTTPPLTATTIFWVRVSNRCGFVNSNGATVTVVP